MDQRSYGSVPHVPSPLASSDHIDICHSSFPYGEAQRPRDALLFQPIHSALVGGIESYLDPKFISDPTAFTSRLPFLHFPGNYAVYDWGFEPAFIRKRNERERQRVKCVNEGYSRLREHLPQEYADKRLSKVETLRAAIEYIKELQGVLGIENKNGFDDKESEDERRQKTPVTPDSESDKLIEENFSKYLDDEDGSISLSNSSRGEQASACSAENEDSLSASLSPKVKIEVPSPSDFADNESSHSTYQQDFPCDFALRGKFLCKTTQSNLKTRNLKSNWADYSTSFTPNSDFGLSTHSPDVNAKNMERKYFYSAPRLDQMNQPNHSNHHSPTTSNFNLNSPSNDAFAVHDGDQMNQPLHEFWKRKNRNSLCSSSKSNLHIYGKDCSYQKEKKY